MSEGPGRLEVLAAILAVAGCVTAVRAAARVAQATRARFTYGAPYREGAIQDRLLGLLMTIPVLFLGIGLGFLAWAQVGFQEDRGTVRVGQIEAHRSGWGKVAVRFVPDPLYPGRQVLEGEVSGARWAVAGDFIVWDRGVRWLGLRDGQRLRYLLGTRDTTGLSPGAGDERTTLEPLSDAASRLMKVARFLPFLKVRTEASQWLPLAERQVMTLYAIGPGYLVEVAAESGRIDRGRRSE